MPSDRYVPVRPSRSEFVELRGLRHHVRRWGEPGAPLLVMLHGWMDVSASFQFLVDELQRDWQVVAPDWRGFGLSARGAGDCYWFPDYVADLEFLLGCLGVREPVRLVGHSMGGNVAMLYAGLRPARVHGLVNLEGFGMPRTGVEDAPARYRRWLDELAQAPGLRDYASLDEVARRLSSNDPRLLPAQARFLASHWAAPNPQGRFEVLGDPAHRIVNPVPYRVEEVLAIWRDITAPVLLLEASDGGGRGWTRTAEYRQRLLAVRDLREARVADAGHMLHHDQPRAVARLLEEFFDA
jgi:pimeloyl-ACP methyl ester carboxylesterase